MNRWCCNSKDKNNKASSKGWDFAVLLLLCNETANTGQDNFTDFNQQATFFFSCWMLQIAGAVEDTLIYINNPSVVQIFIYIEKQKKTYCDIVTCATQMSLQPLHRNPIFTHASGNQLSMDVQSHNDLMQIFTISVCQWYHLQTKANDTPQTFCFNLFLVCRIKLRWRSFSSSSFFF